MKGEIAQLVALTCHGNAMLRGITVSQFFPGNSTCRFAEYVRFHDSAGGAERAATPDQWFENLRLQEVKGLVLRQAPMEEDDSGDRLMAGFVGGGGVWAIEAVRADGRSDFWTSEWDTGDQPARDDRIWRIDYFRHEGGPTVPHGLRSLQAVRSDFETALRDIRAFSVRYSGNEGFTRCFEGGLAALRTGEHPGYHGDLFPRKSLAPEAQGLLEAASAAWVFGGMGSWNDQGFPEGEQEDYDRVSAALYNVINEAIAVAASSSWPGSGIG